MTRFVKIVSTGKYLPKRKVYSTELDAKLGLPEGTVEAKSGVHVRHQIQGETLVQMGCAAAKMALDKAGMDAAQIDVIISAGGIMQQPIPCTAALMQEELGLGSSGIPSFDINSTCLSFVTALDQISYLIQAGRYKNALIISADISSCGIDYEHLESACLFGDGASSAIISKTPEGGRSAIVSAGLKTYSDGAHLCEIQGGLSYKTPQAYAQHDPKDYLFKMDGRKVFKLSMKYMPDFIQSLLEPAKSTINDVGLVIPHQASYASMALMQRKLELPDEKVMYTIANHGNTIASSIPIALHEAIEQKRMARGDQILLLGTSAGLSIGGALLVY